MFVAYNADNKLISIENATAENKYYCPGCGAPLTIRAKGSLAVKTHFAHKRGSDCDNWTHDMSEWHLSWQKRFPIQNREVVIEKNGIKHRADVCINNAVIEFQHSPIKAEEIAQRNEFYLSCGYRVVWVFDAESKLTNPFERTIDPIRCRPDDLRWKREKQQFSLKMPQGVTVFLHYKTPVSVRELNGKDVEIMLLLTEVAPKKIVFFKTDPYYIFPNNFVKEFGSSLECPSVSGIIAEARRERMLREERKREIDKIKAETAFNSILARGGHRRKWRF